LRAEGFFLKKDHPRFLFLKIFDNAEFKFAEFPANSGALRRLK
jgi:hypothetical protein